jgi:hypothetical protein
MRSGSPSDVATHRCFHRIAALLALVLGGTSASAHAELFVCAGSSIRVFADDAGGNAPPLRVMEGPATGIDECYGLALDRRRGELYVAHGAVSVFAADAQGNAPPLRRIDVDDAEQVFAIAVAVDTVADEVVVGTTGGRILTYARTASGTTPPRRRILGQPQGLGNVMAVVVDRSSGVIVATSYGGSATGVVAFDRLASGEAPLARPLIALPASGLYPVAGLVLWPSQQRIYVATSASAVQVFDYQNMPLGTVAATPTPGTPFGLALSDDRVLYVASRATPLETHAAVYPFVLDPGGATFPLASIALAAPPQRQPLGLVSSRAIACSAGNVVSECEFRDGFEK